MYVFESGIRIFLLRHLQELLVNISCTNYEGPSVSYYWVSSEFVEQAEGM